ncbi:MAG TPA: hypothetical protein VGN97_08700 [Mesorhizobium sp.]|jgi:hypothetical protein|nr:hypothetical protein [Mesorhizobium sp.]
MADLMRTGQPRVLEAMMNTSGAHWTLEAVQALKALVKEGTPASLISLKLKRSIAEVRAKISELGLTPAADT